MSRQRKILAELYFTSSTPHGADKLVGIVAAETDEHLPQEERTWQSYLAVVTGTDQKQDAQLAANYGQKLSAEQAIGFFPQFEIEKYKTYSE